MNRADWHYLWSAHHYEFDPIILGHDMSDTKDQHEEKEAQERFEKALRGGLKTPPKPLKDIQGMKTESDKRRAPSRRMPV